MRRPSAQPGLTRASSADATLALNSPRASKSLFPLQTTATSASQLSRRMEAISGASDSSASRNASQFSSKPLLSSKRKSAITCSPMSKWHCSPLILSAISTAILFRYRS